MRTSSIKVCLLILSTLLALSYFWWDSLVTVLDTKNNVIALKGLSASLNYVIDKKEAEDLYRKLTDTEDSEKKDDNNEATVPTYQGEENHNETNSEATTFDPRQKVEEETEVTTLTTEGNEIDKLVRKMADLHENRRKHMRETCANSFGETAEESTPNQHDMYCDTYKFTICWLYKCSFSSWVWAVLVSDGVYKHEQGPELYGNPEVIENAMNHTIAKLPKEMQRKVWDEYTKVILVRHPFERLVSAYNDKMVPDGEGFSWYYAPISRDINKRFRHLRHNITARRDVGDGTATFEDFVNYLVQLGPPGNRDEHWRQYHATCDPCKHDYDVIMKFDSYLDDFESLKQLLNVSEHHRQDFFPPFKARTDNDKTKVFMESIPVELRRKLYEIYRKDFELFGYEKPDYV